MDNFDLKKFVSEKTLLNESAPGFDTRKTGEALPTLESVKAAYEEKKGITYDPYGDHETEEVEEGNITEEQGVVVSPSEIMMHINQYQKGNIDGDDLAQAIEEIVGVQSQPQEWDHLMIKVQEPQFLLVI